MRAHGRRMVQPACLRLGLLMFVAACGDDPAGVQVARDAGPTVGTDGPAKPADASVPGDAQPRERASELPPGPDLAATEAPVSDAPSPVDTMATEASAGDAPPAIDTGIAEVSGIDQATGIDAGTPIGGWRQYCPNDEVPDWDAAPPDDAIAPPDVAATQLAAVPTKCGRCLPQVAVDDANIIYVLGTESQQASSPGSIAVSLDGGKTFAPSQGTYLPLDSSVTLHIAAGRPGRLFAIGAASGCTTLIASWDGGQSWPFRKSLMPGQSDLRMVALGQTLAIAGATQGSGVLAVSLDEGMTFTQASFATDGPWELLGDRATGALFIVTLHNGVVALWPWDLATGTLLGPNVTGLPVDAARFAVSDGFLAAATTDGTRVFKTSFAALQTVTLAAVPTGASVKAVRGDAYGSFTLVAYWDEPNGTSASDGPMSIRGYAAFRLSRAATALGPATPVDLARVPTAAAYVSAGTGADIVPVSENLALVADGFGVPHIAVSLKGRVLDWRLPPDPFPQ